MTIRKRKKVGYMILMKYIFRNFWSCWRLYANGSCHINVIISAGLNEIMVCCHPTVIYQMGLVDWREVCFAWLPPLDRFTYVFIYLFIYLQNKDGKIFSWISCYQSWFVRQQTNNSLSPVFVINNYSLPTMFLKWFIWIVINLGSLRIIFER